MRDFVNIRAAARQRGDYGLADAMTAELERLGHKETPAASGAFETAVPEELERAVPEKKRGRPPRPRCEHDRIVGRCVECDDDLAA